MIIHVLTTLFQDAYLDVQPDAGYFLEWLDEVITNFPDQDLCSGPHTHAWLRLLRFVSVCVCL